MTSLPLPPSRLRVGTLLPWAGGGGWGWGWGWGFPEPEGRGGRGGSWLWEGRAGMTVPGDPALGVAGRVRDLRPPRKRLRGEVIWGTGLTSEAESGLGGHCPPRRRVRIGAGGRDQDRQIPSRTGVGSAG